MIGLDTNILVRYLAQDDPAQSARAIALLEGELTADNPGYVSLVVMVEIAWVLERAYLLSNAELAAAIERMLQADALVIESEQDVFTAMIAVKSSQASFADALIATLGIRAGCERTLTFDRKAVRYPGFALV